MRFLPIAAVAFALILPGTAHAAAQSSTTMTYVNDSTTIIANPGRGFVTYTETHLNAAANGYVPLEADTLEAARVADQRTVVFRLFYLEKYSDGTAITKDDLALIKADFQAARKAGVKLVIRFAYTSADGPDAPGPQIVRHIAQLRLTLLVNADVIQAIQAGFLGASGEWHYPDIATAGPTDPGPVTNVEWSRRKVVVNALLAATSASTTIQVRSPQIKRRLYPSGPQALRIGVHDDCFLAGDDDNGTFAPTDDAWLAAQSPSTLVGGKTCTLSDRSNTPAEMARHHWTYLDPLAGNAGLDLADAERRLGYRFRLVDASLPTAARPVTKISARITVTNDGYASPTLKRPVRLVMSNGTLTRSVEISTDVRAWTPGRTVSMSFSFTAPSTPGDYGLYLYLPDLNPTLSNANPLLANANPVPYAIRMANDGAWDDTHGWNSLGVTLGVVQ